MQIDFKAFQGYEEAAKVLRYAQIAFSAPDGIGEEMVDELCYMIDDLNERFPGMGPRVESAICRGISARRTV